MYLNTYNIHFHLTSGNNHIFNTNFKFNRPKKLPNNNEFRYCQPKSSATPTIAPSL